MEKIETTKTETQNEPKTESSKTKAKTGKKNGSSYWISDMATSLTVDDVLLCADIKSRRLFIDEDISADMANYICLSILRYNAEDKGVESSKRKPVALYINSNGGSTSAMFSIIDAVKTSVTPIYTINIGVAYSAAFMIALAGAKRLATPNASYLMHEGSGYIGNSMHKLQETAEFFANIDKREKDFVLKNSSLTEEKYNEKSRTEWFMFSDEAKQYGFVDYIIGEDGMLDDFI